MLSRGEEIEWENTVSLNKQRETRARRAKAKSNKDAEKTELKYERLDRDGVSSTKARRAIKEKYAKIAEEAMNVGGAKEAETPQNFYSKKNEDPREQSDQSPSTTFESNNPPTPDDEPSDVDPFDGDGFGGDNFELDIVTDGNTAGRASFSGTIL